jgi:transcription elongation factor GreB
VSKAFTKEDDSGGEDLSAMRPQGPELPPGSRNYMTPAGAARVRAELDELLQSPARKDSAHRIRYLQMRMDQLEIVVPAGSVPDRVRFGTTVTLADENDEERSYQIVGVDEADPKSGKVSWISPLATAILGARIGESVTLRTPKGEETFVVARITG